MELNRMGEWEQAAQLADQFLQNGATKPQAERCHAYTNLALNEPGTSWAYSNEGAQLLSPLLDKAAGEPIQDYARKRLFKPLGMQRTRLHLDEKKHAWTYADMETTPREMARIGLLMLNKGMWQGQRVVSESWVAQSTRKSQALEPHYGLLGWLYDSPQGYAALGYLDTNLYVFPHQELIVVRMQSKPFNSSFTK